MRPSARVTPVTWPASPVKPVTLAPSSKLTPWASWTVLKKVVSFSQANRFIQSLKELGCKFALDDFGTGLSSFGYLKHFPVDYLKIDGSFVREILRDPIDREMVSSINEIGHLTGKQTIAEFAENAEIIQMLTNIGVDYAQGYGVAQPQRLLKSVSTASSPESVSLPAGTAAAAARR